MKRYPYDLSHFTFVPADIGRLQTISTVPVVAGDTIELDYRAIARLSALRRNLTLDCQIDLFAFFVSYRHVYGIEWTDFIKSGQDEAVTFTSGPNASGQRYFGCTLRGTAVAIPLWLTAGYNRIWNRYFRVPTDTSGVKADNYISATSGREFSFGELCGRMKTPWNTGIDPTTDTSDKEVASATVLDIIALAQVQARYESEQQRDWFAQRYNDLLQVGWGGGANPDADERPYFLMRQSNTLSGYDVDGTADANLGSFAGKSAGVVKLYMPPRFFPEHGTIWVMALPRFPTVNHQEAHFLTQQTNPSYIEIAGDADLIAAQAPHIVRSEDWFADGNGVDDLGTIPYGQWYRHHPNYVHDAYKVLTGFPFSLDTPGSADNARYFVDKEFDSAFATMQLGQVNFSGYARMPVKRVVPPARSSIFAGTIGNRK